MKTITGCYSSMGKNWAQKFARSWRRLYSPVCNLLLQAKWRSKNQMSFPTLGESDLNNIFRGIWKFVWRSYYCIPPVFLSDENLLLLPLHQRVQWQHKSLDLEESKPYLYLTKRWLLITQLPWTFSWDHAWSVCAVAPGKLLNVAYLLQDTCLLQYNTDICTVHKQ
jgi:hypothetical protein